MRYENLLIAAALLIASAPIAAATEPEAAGARLPHGTQLLGPLPLRRTDIETSESVFVVDRADLAAAEGEPLERVAPPPPPDIDAPLPEPVEEATADTKDDAPSADTETIEETPLPEKVRPSDELAPTVTIRTEGDLTIEEYRRNGQIYMVVVVPKKGPRYTYLDTDGDGRLEGDPDEGPIQPVYYTLYEWE